jgi:C4-dicarboxylate transporter, DctM subunit
MILLTVPILLPILNVMEIELLWFGVFVVLLGELSMLTPPVGILGYVLHRLVQDREVRGDTEISLVDVFVGGAWFIPLSLLVLFLLMLEPDLALWLPSRGG